MVRLGDEPGTFVGRAAELESLIPLVRERAGSALAYVHGPAGIGKSALLSRLRDEAVGIGRPVAVLAPGGRPDGLAALASPVVVVDGVETVTDPAGWLRGALLPAVPDGALVLLAGRGRPDPQWWVEPVWDHDIVAYELDGLEPEAAHALLESYGFPGEIRSSAVAYSEGYPAVLCGALDTPAQPADWSPSAERRRELLDRIVGVVPSPEHQQALEVCALALTTNEAVLRQVVNDQAGSVFRWMRALPFLRAQPGGLAPMGAVRRLISDELRSRDPAAYRRLHRTLREHFVGAVRRGVGEFLESGLDAVGYLHRRVTAAEALIDTDRHEGELRRCDHEALVALAGAAHGPALAEVTRFWLARDPAGFRVRWDARTGAVEAFTLWLRLAGRMDAEATADPAVAAIRRYVEAAGPVTSDEAITVGRLFVRSVTSRSLERVAETQLLSRAVRAGWPGWTFLLQPPGAEWHSLSAYFDLYPFGPDPTGEGNGVILGRDWRRSPLGGWLDQVDERIFDGARSHGRPLTMPRGDFDDEVRRALRHLRDRRGLETSPLLRTRLVADAVDGAAALRSAIRDAVESLKDRPDGMKQFRAVSTAYLSGVSTQDAAAARLGVPISTFRRHLALGVRGVCDRLWREQFRVRSDVGHREAG
ncbi:ATP-binding protein [Virgisporangium aliadipatigenens]|uniref:ATP-binding protein n=1 Tax=Virgisporangium aliadipatigenens TaxID=741659 RepID=UPI001941418B|nr:ATP-binding protein [Virgisporangium aliadipatigenens]